MLMTDKGSEFADMTQRRQVEDLSVQKARSKQAARLDLDHDSNSVILWIPG